MTTTTRLPQRIQRRRTAGWRMPDGAVYVGRPTVYGNPFRVGVTYCGPTLRCPWTPTEVVAAFRTWIALDTLHPLFWDRALITAHTALKAALRRGDLRGRDLACWCPPGTPCHADVLLEIANSPDDDVFDDELGPYSQHLAWIAGHEDHPDPMTKAPYAGDFRSCATCGDDIWPGERTWPVDGGVECAICHVKREDG